MIDPIIYLKLGDCLLTVLLSMTRIAIKINSMYQEINQLTVWIMAMMTYLCIIMFSILSVYIINCLI